MGSTPSSETPEKTNVYKQLENDIQRAIESVERIQLVTLPDERLPVINNGVLVLKMLNDYATELKNLSSNGNKCTG